MKHKPSRPVVRYLGGKHRLAPKVVALMPPHSVYVEPWGGGASVLLAKSPVACEVYNDLCGEVSNVFRQLRDAPDVLLRGLFLTPYAREEYLQAYEPTTDAVEAARRFIFRSMAGLGSDASRRVSGFRTTLDDGRYAHARSWAGLPESLATVCDRLRGVIIETKDALDVIRQFDSPQTLIYADPPYMGDTRRQKARQYTHELKSEDEHAVVLEALSKAEGKVMISGYASKLYKTKLKGWHVETFAARDQLNGKREEVLWMNFRPEDLLPLE